MKKLRIFKALSKQEEPNVCWDAIFFNPFLNFNQLPAAKKGFKKRCSSTNVCLFLFCQGFNREEMQRNIKSDCSMHVPFRLNAKAKN